MKIVPMDAMILNGEFKNSLLKIKFNKNGRIDDVLMNDKSMYNIESMDIQFRPTEPTRIIMRLIDTGK